MPATILFGHLLAALSASAILASLAFAYGWFRHRGFGRGTPQYARARTARRSAAYALVLALVFIIGWFTPLGYVPIMGRAG